MGLTLRYLKKVFFRKEIWLTLCASSFTLFLLIFEFNHFTINYRESFELIYDETLQFETAAGRLAIHVFIIFVLTVIFIGASFISQNKFKPLYFILFSLIIIVEYGYQNANDNFMALHDLRTALGSVQNWDDAIPAYFNSVALIPILIYGALLLSLRPSFKADLRLLGGVLLIIFSVNVGIYLYTGFNQFESRLRIFAAGPTVSLQAFFRMITNATLEQILAYHGSRDLVDFQAETQPLDNIVFIIDESVRYDHLSLNGYERSTTPYLESLASDGVLYNWGRTAAGSTCSYRSVALLLTGVTDLPDRTYRIKQNPTLFQYAKAMNYKTYYLDGGSKSPRFALTENDFQYVDEWLHQDHFGNDYKTDFRIAAHTTDVLNQSAGNFVVIFKRGSHFPYNENFPRKEAIWKPLLSGNQIVSDDVKALVNSYDNSIAYNLDSFFEALLVNRELLDNTTILYTSDHGETLGEQTYPHCGDTKNEAAVPLFIIAHEGWVFDLDYPANHHNTFATLLDLMKFPGAERDYSYTLSLLAAESSDARPRYYFHGSLFGFDEYGWSEFD